MTTSSVPFLTRRAVNPILSDRPIFDEEGEQAAPFLTAGGRRMHRYIPLASALLAGLFLGVAWMTEKVHGPEPLAHLSVLVAFVLGGIPGLQSAWASLLERRIDIDVLMILGAGLAAVIGQPIEGAMLLFLFALSGALEQEATRRTQTAIRSLRDLNPAFALVLDESGESRRVPSTHVGLGARVLVRPGDRVPLDGAVIEGESAIDEAPITGESVPRYKTLGDNVFAGTINGNGRLVVEVKRVAAETQLAKIIKLVTQAHSKQARVERLFDRISPTYALCVIGAAVVLGAGAPLVSHLRWGGEEGSVYRAIALLIVASPCALIIATPIAYLSAIAAAARKGVLIKGGVYLEVLARCKSVVFDKTGTLTVGRPRVCEIVQLDGLPEQEALEVAGALEASSSHPLASAINAAIAERGLKVPQAAGVELVAGRGVRGHIDGQQVALGRAELIADVLGPAAGASVAAAVDAVYASGRTAAAVAVGRRSAVLAFDDPLREDAPAAIARLRSVGVRQAIMLTGDNERVARRIAEKLHLDGYYADLMPEAKIERAEEIRAKSGAAVAMVGDGVNDAPALARADVGIAMASIGSDAALEAAPIVLMSNSLERLGWLFEHAHRTAHIVRQNLTLALSVIVLLSGFAIAGQVKLPLAVIAHEGSTLLVAANALRLLRAK
jgi:Zn2+/Cd2+-exporting ATPase